MTVEIKNALITNVSLSNDDHGILSAWLHLDYGGTTQGFGGYALYTPSPQFQEKNYTGIFIWRCLEIGGVHKWEQLPGKTIRVVCDMSKIHKIGHILKDVWFDPAKEMTP